MKSRPPKTTPPGEKASPKTKTLPEEQRGLWFEGVDQVTAIIVFGSALIFDLPRGTRRFTLGSGDDCDVAIPTPFLSTLHLVMERRGPKLRITDQGSKNGTYFADARDQVFDVRAGDTFYAGSIRFLLLNDVMRAAHPTFVELLGGDDDTTLYNEAFKSRPSDALTSATSNTRHILVTGEPGCDHVRLARAIHQVSRLRERAAIEMEDLPKDRAKQREILDAASRSTLILRIDDKAPILDPAFASMIFSTSYHVRVIACASSLDVAIRVLTETYTRTMGNIELLPLARRKGSICRILDRVLADMGSELRATNLSSSNQTGIDTRDWPNNFDDLREVAKHLDLIHREGSLRKAAERLKVPLASYHYMLRGFGVSTPLH
jgi:hypothetical protein